MACPLLPLHAPLSSLPRPLLSRSPFILAPRALPLVRRGPRASRHLPLPPAPPPRALPDVASAAAEGLRGALADAFLANPPTWSSAAASNLAIFVAGSPVVLSGLSASGFAAAYLLGTLTWRAFGTRGFLLVVVYFVVGTAATKLKIKQKEALGVAEKRGGRRGPGSVIGSSAAGCVCALLSVYNVGGAASAELWRLGFVASFCTKLSDTVSSEIGKAYGRTTYLVTTFKVVPRGTEGAVSIEGTLAGILASIFLAGVGYILVQVNISQCAVCVLASQIANFGESFIGATLQDKEGFEWGEIVYFLKNNRTLSKVSMLLILGVFRHYICIVTAKVPRKTNGEYYSLQLNNDVVNVLNISAGGILAVLMQQLLLSWRS